MHCEDFNDDLLIIAVSHIGAHWELIRTLDSILNGENAQFELYTANQLHERWQILVNRSKLHMKRVKKLQQKRLQVAQQKHMGESYMEKSKQSYSIIIVPQERILRSSTLRRR